MLSSANCAHGLRYPFEGVRLTGRSPSAIPVRDGYEAPFEGQSGNLNRPTSLEGEPNSAVIRALTGSQAVSPPYGGSDDRRPSIRILSQGILKRKLSMGIFNRCKMLKMYVPAVGEGYYPVFSLLSVLAVASDPSRSLGLKNASFFSSRLTSWDTLYRSAFETSC